MALKAWNIQITNTTKFFDSIPDTSLAKEVAPGKNSLLYLLGHLVAVNEGMLTLFGLGERKYAHLDEPFVKMPDKSGLTIPDAAYLRAAWKQSNEEITASFNRMDAKDWFSKHSAMTDEDLAKEPGRNKLSVLISRTNHVAYHLGQLVLAKELSS
jgi:uncharacterized damage-inducible protein DinB